jgi:inner membrane transporter RhtA
VGLPEIADSEIAHPPSPSGETRLATALVLGSITSVQCGAALATTLFDRVGPGGAVFLRGAFAALAMGIAVRGRIPRLERPQLLDLALFALILAAMNLCFYAAIDRLPLGVAVTFEFAGPLGVAIFGSRRPRDLLWALLAAAGIVLLADPSGGGSLDGWGVVLALAAGAFWAAYILQAARIGRTQLGLAPLAVAMAISAVVLIPVGLAGGGAELLEHAVLAVGLGVGLLSSAIPYAFELEALRRLPAPVFGVLMSLEPAVAALVGFVALSQGLGAREALAIALVVLASAGALRSAASPAPLDG